MADLNINSFDMNIIDKRALGLSCTYEKTGITLTFRANLHKFVLNIVRENNIISMFTSPECGTAKDGSKVGNDDILYRI